MIVMHLTVIGEREQPVASKESYAILIDIKTVKGEWLWSPDLHSSL